MTANSPRSTSNAIELIALTKRYSQGKPAVDSINLRISSGSGSYCCLLGPSGCVRNTCRTPGDAPDAPTFEIITKPNQTQKRALDLIDQIKP